MSSHGYADEFIPEPKPRNDCDVEITLRYRDGSSAQFVRREALDAARADFNYAQKCAVETIAALEKRIDNLHSFIAFMSSDGEPGRSAEIVDEDADGQAPYAAWVAGMRLASARIARERRSNGFVMADRLARLIVDMCFNTDFESLDDGVRGHIFPVIKYSEHGGFKIQGTKDDVRAFAQSMLDELLR